MRSLGEKIALRYILRTFKSAPIALGFVIGPIHNKLTKGEVVELEDEKGEIADRQHIVNRMRSYIKRSIENRVSSSWRLLTIAGNAASKESWKLDEPVGFNVDFWLYESTSVKVLGNIEAKTDTEEGATVICYRNLRTTWHWEDNIDANSFRESWSKGMYGQALKAEPYVAPVLIGRILFENATDIVNEKLNSADFSVRVTWHYRSESGRWFK